MSGSKGKIGLCVLQYALAISILIMAVRFVLPSAAHNFAQSHMPGFVRLVIGFGEILGSVLLLIPKTVTAGAWILFAVFVMGILLHLLHGSLDVGSVVIYAAAAFAIGMGRGN